MHPEHRKLLAELKKQRDNGTQHTKNDSYLLSGHRYYDVSVPLRRRIAKDWLREHGDISAEDFVSVLDSLYRGDSHDEKTLGSYLLGYHHRHRKAVLPEQLDDWLDHLVGWAEIDALCQNVFTAEELLSDWETWETFIRKLSKDTNINKRRAALVLLTGPTHRSDDRRLRDLAFAIIDALKHEQPILITKAISWLLREMSAQHRDAVVEYLREHEETLPKIALRETRRKLKTGRK